MMKESMTIQKKDKVSTIREYNIEDFTEEQRYILENARNAGLNVRVLANPELNAFQMEQVYMALENALPAVLFADPKYSASQMQEIRMALESGLDISPLMDPTLSAERMATIRNELEQARLSAATPHKAIFLDFDGVINWCACDAQNFKDIGLDEDDIYNYMSPWAVQRIIEICRRTGAHVVYNSTVGYMAYNDPESLSNDPCMCTPTGENITTMLKEAGVQVDGIAFDISKAVMGYRNPGKLESVAMYKYYHPEITDIVIIEDGALFKETARQECRKEIETDRAWLLPVFDSLEASCHIDTNIYTDTDHAWGQPMGLTDEDVERAVAILGEREEPCVYHDEEEL